MKKVAAIQILQKINKQIFTLVDLKKLLHIESDNTAYKQVEGLIKSGILIRAVKGIYYLSIDIPSDFELANAIYWPSYISVESALNYYGILIQSPQQITSITTKVGKQVEINDKEFAYSHLDNKYYSDYEKVAGFIIATPEKALIDAMFFTALGKGHLNIDELILESIDKKKLNKLAGKISNQAFKKYFNSIEL